MPGVNEWCACMKLNPTQVYTLFEKVGVARLSGDDRDN